MPPIQVEAITWIDLNRGRSCTVLHFQKVFSAGYLWHGTGAHIWLTQLPSCQLRATYCHEVHRHRKDFPLPGALLCPL